MDFIAVGVFQACGLGKRLSSCRAPQNCARKLPALFILNYLFPLYGLAYAQMTAEIILSVAAVIVLRRIFKQLEKETSPAKA